MHHLSVVRYFVPGCLNSRVSKWAKNRLKLPCVEIVLACPGSISRKTKYQIGQSILGNLTLSRETKKFQPSSRSLLIHTYYAAITPTGTVTYTVRRLGPATQSRNLHAGGSVTLQLTPPRSLCSASISSSSRTCSIFRTRAPNCSTLASGQHRESTIALKHAQHAFAAHHKAIRAAR